MEDLEVVVRPSISSISWIEMVGTGSRHRHNGPMNRTSAMASRRGATASGVPGAICRQPWRPPWRLASAI